MMEAALLTKRVSLLLKYISATAILFGLSGCSHSPSAPTAALASFTGDRILGHIRTLSSEEFEGRGPGSKG